MRIVRGLAAVLALAAALAPHGAMARPTKWLTGVVTGVIDGDTIMVEGRAVRLWGVHAPERRDADGLAAQRWMAARALGQVVVCRLRGGRSHGRLVAVCRDGDGDLAAGLIGAGLGRDCPRFSRSHYAAGELAAASRLALPGYCLNRSGGARHGGT